MDDRGVMGGVMARLVVVEESQGRSWVVAEVVAQ
jgi:hypothetical protein